MIYKVKSQIEDFEPKSKFIPVRTFDKNFMKSYSAWIKRKTRIHKVDAMKARKIIRCLFKNAAEEIINKDAGVVLEGIGYFGFYMPFYRRTRPIFYKNGAVSPPRYKTDYYTFIPYLFTDVFSGTNKLEGWSIERAFSRKFERGWVKDKRHRLLFYKEVKSIYDTYRHDNS